MEFYWRREWTAPSIVGVVSFGIGTAVGYTIAMRRPKIIEAVKEIEYVALTSVPDDEEESDGEFVTVEEAIEHIRNMDLSTSLEIDVETVSVFSDDVVDHEWDYAVEEQHRRNIGRGIPYILHRDEYFDDGKHYTQSTLTYYKGDDVLTDEHDVPIYNYKQIVGPENLIFGRGSGDENIVFIRNDHLEAEYEIILDQGFYEVEVLGQELGDRLSAEKTVIPKFRPE
jgi:hypothetical protein